ncbi:MAG: hypothetical protein HQ594_05980 [Candidatus Omnitrophica bacterium]|nr:hypothetical protein [Candidatus Omnitrophota bacterium]
MSIFKKKRRLFGEIAVKKGLVSERDIAGALEIQRDYVERHDLQKKIGAILIEKGVLSPVDVEAILEEQKPQASLMAWFTALFNLSR